MQGRRERESKSKNGRERGVNYSKRKLVSVSGAFSRCLLITNSNTDSENVGNLPRKFSKSTKESYRFCLLT